MTFEQVMRMAESGKLVHHHSASARGYVGANESPRVYGYEGRYGSGVEVHYPNKMGYTPKRGSRVHFSNNFHQVDYYVVPV